MKFLSLLFASAILLLAIKPGVDFIAFSEMETDSCGITCGTETNQSNAESDAHNDCSEEICNPFHSCCNNVLYHKSNNVFIQFSELIISKKLVFFYNSIFKSEFENSFWQPPKFV